MTLLESMRAAQNGQALRNLGRRFGLSQGEIDQAMRALVPALIRALRRLAESRTGAPAVHALVAEGAYERYLDEPNAFAQPSASEDGERVLREIFESERERREVAQGAAGAADVTQETADRLMPLVAALTMGTLGRSMHQSQDRINTGPEETSGGTRARMLASLLGNEDDSPHEKP